MSVGDKIRRVREEKGISLSELGEKVDIPASCLEDVEKGRRRLGKETLKKLAYHLGMPEDFFITAGAGEDPEDGDEKDPVEYISSSVGRKIRQTREAMGLTLVECGKRAGISYTHISEIERDNACPSLKTLEKLANALNKPVSYFLSGDTCITLGEKVRKLREAQGLTQAKLARQVGLSDSLIAQIETGKAQPSLNTLDRLADVLGVSTSYFLTQDGEIPVQDGQVVRLREWNADKKTNDILHMLQRLDEGHLDFLKDLVSLFNQYVYNRVDLAGDPLTAEITQMVKDLSPEEKHSLLDYIKFLASKRQIQANVKG